MPSTTYKDLQIAGKNIEWDSGSAIKKVKAWATSNDEIDFSKYSQAFFWVNSNNKDNQGGYKLPFATIMNGKLTAIPRGIYAAAAAIQGARGGVDIPENDVTSVKNHIAKYYKKLDEIPPWSKKVNDMLRNMAGK